MTKRGERAVPPVPPHGWTLRFIDKAAAEGWRDLWITYASTKHPKLTE